MQCNGIGKKLANARYIHDDGLKISDETLFSFITRIREEAGVSKEYNVLKLFTLEFKVSFLSNPDIFDHPHPELKASIVVDLATGKIRRFDYSHSQNPPILHRKETLLDPAHPLIPQFSALTEAEEKAGGVRTALSTRERLIQINASHRT